MLFPASGRLFFVELFFVCLALIIGKRVLGQNAEIEFLVVGTDDLEVIVSNERFF